MNDRRWYIILAILFGVIALMFLLLSIQGFNHSLEGRNYNDDMLAAKLALVMFGFFSGLASLFLFFYQKNKMEEENRDRERRPWMYRGRP